MHFDHYLQPNPKLLSKDWQMSDDERRIIDKYNSESVLPAIDFWLEILNADRLQGYECESIPGVAPQAIKEMRHSDQAFVELCSTLKDPAVVKRVAQAMNSPNHATMDDSWLEFRRVQTWALHALVLLKKHPPRTELPNRTNLEHDVQDLEYLMLGLHCGALASCETNPSPVQAKMIWRYKLLQPDGHCVTS